MLNHYYGIKSSHKDQHLQLTHNLTHRESNFQIKLQFRKILKKLGLQKAIWSVLEVAICTLLDIDFSSLAQWGLNDHSQLKLKYRLDLHQKQ
jgi:hypothetical protein